jgi:hypothetical protein
MFNLTLIEKDEIASRKGYVNVIYNVGRFNISRLYSQVPPILVKALNCLPTKFVALHLCFSILLFRIVAQNVLKVLMFRRALRAGGGKVHQGMSNNCSWDA